MSPLVESRAFQGGSMNCVWAFGRAAAEFLAEEPLPGIELEEHVDRVVLEVGEAARSGDANVRDCEFRWSGGRPAARNPPCRRRSPCPRCCPPRRRDAAGIARRAGGPSEPRPTSCSELNWSEPSGSRPAAIWSSSRSTGRTAGLEERGRRVGVVFEQLRRPRAVVGRGRSGRRDCGRPGSSCPAGNSSRRRECRACGGSARASAPRRRRRGTSAPARPWASPDRPRSPQREAPGDGLVPIDLAADRVEREAIFLGLGAPVRALRHADAAHQDPEEKRRLVEPKPPRDTVEVDEEVLGDDQLDWIATGWRLVEERL